MWRSFFLAVAIMLIILGVECLMIDSAAVYSASETNTSNFIDPSGGPSRSTKTWKPAEWMPWALLSAGAVTIIYAVTLPKRWGHAG